MDKPTHSTPFDAIRRRSPVAVTRAMPAPHAHAFSARACAPHARHRASPRTRCRAWSTSVPSSTASTSLERDGFVESTPMKVYIEDTDAYGVVYYANYFRFTDRAAQEAFECALEQGRGWFEGASASFRELSLVSISNVKYARGAVLGDEVIVRTTIMDADAHHVRLMQDVIDKHGGLYLSAQTTYARPDGARAATTGIGAAQASTAPSWSTTRVMVYRDEQSGGVGGGCSHVDVMRFFERGRSDAIGGSAALAELKSKHNVIAVVSRLDAVFPMKIFADITRAHACEVRSTVTLKRRNIQVVFHQELYDVASGERVAAANITCTCLDAANMKPISCPPALIDIFAPILTTA